MIDLNVMGALYTPMLRCPTAQKRTGICCNPDQRGATPHQGVNLWRDKFFITVSWQPCDEMGSEWGGR